MEHNFDSLQSRRESRDYSFARKILLGTIDCPWLLERLELLVPRDSSRGSATFRVPFARTNVGLKSRIGHLIRNVNKSNLEMFV